MVADPPVAGGTPRLRVEAVLELEITRVSRGGTHGQPLSAPLELLEQGGIAIKRGHAVAAAGEVERDPPGAGADIEDGIAVTLRQRPPQWDVGGIAAAFDVVPDDRCQPRLHEPGR